MDAFGDTEGDDDGVWHDGLDCEKGVGRIADFWGFVNYVLLYEKILDRGLCFGGGWGGVEFGLEFFPDSALEFCVHVFVEGVVAREADEDDGVGAGSCGILDDALSERRVGDDVDVFVELFWWDVSSVFADD